MPIKIENKLTLFIGGYADGLEIKISHSTDICTFGKPIDSLIEPENQQFADEHIYNRELISVGDKVYSIMVYELLGKNAVESLINYRRVS